MSASPARDTIAAVATPPGKGGIGIIRISGELSRNVIDAVLKKPLQARRAHFLPFHDRDGAILDSGLALFFPAPHSFTGEDVLELHGHGSPFVLDLLLRRVLSLGVRIARPGEFSERAFLNDKIDLAQAEAIADLIESATEQAARSAQRSLQGEFSKVIDELVEALINLRLYVEAAIDFVEEEIDFLSEGAIGEKLRDLLTRLERIQRSAQQGCLLREGMTLVIAGRPNVGKSSLLNCLAERETAIVTEMAGTTRDTLREYIQIDGLPLHVIDTAGLRESEDMIEKEGMRRAREAMAKADRILLMIDDRYPEANEELLSELPGNLAITRIYNKIDLTGREAGIGRTEAGTEIRLSVKTGAGLDLLRRHLKACAGYDSEADDVFIARRRHLDALARAREAILSGIEQLEGSRAPELLAEDLRQAQTALSEITGAFTTEDLLDRVFSSFCIGK
jgi:tRNA modification GTPase